MSVAGQLWRHRRYAARVVFCTPRRAWQTYQRLVHESVTGHYRPHGDPTQADCAVAFCSSDQANKDMAWHYLPDLRVRYPELPFILSPEIYDLYVRDRDESAEALCRLSKSVGTHESALEMRVVMFGQGLEHPLLVALDRHMPRMDAAVQWFNYRTIVPDDLHSIRLTTTDPTHEKRWRRKQPAVVAFYILAGRVMLDA